MKIIYVIICTLALSGCSMFSMHESSEGSKYNRETSEKTETKINEKGTPSLVSNHTAITVDSEGAVTINPSAPSLSSSGEGMNFLSPEIIAELRGLAWQRNSDQSSSFDETVEIEYHKTVAYFSGLMVVAVAIGFLIFVKVAKNATGVIKSYGFDPKLIGKSASVMFSVIGKVREGLDRESSSLTDLRSRNGLSSEAYDQIERTMIKLSEFKGMIAKADGIECKHSW